MIEVLIGIAGGLLVGATGIGSGSLIAPLLIAAGHRPEAAVGSGLACLIVSKFTAAELHRELGHFPGRVAVPVIAGGLAGVVWTWAGTALLGHFTLHVGAFLQFAIGVVLLVVAATLVAPQSLAPRIRFPEHLRETPWMLFIAGAAIAVVVTLTSAGSGGLLLPILLLLTRWRTPELAAVSSLYGVIVGAAAIAVYIAHNSLDLALIANVMIGLLPGVVVGTALARMISRTLLARSAALVAGCLGCALLFKL